MDNRSESHLPIGRLLRLLVTVQLRHASRSQRGASGVEYALLVVATAGALWVIIDIFLYGLNVIFEEEVSKIEDPTPWAH